MARCRSAAGRQARTSPSPSPPVRRGRRPDGDSSLKSACHQRRPGIFTQARPDDRAGRNRDDVLGRPAELRADRVVVAIEPERRVSRGTRARDCSRRPASLLATTVAAGRPAAISCAKLGPVSIPADGAGHLRQHLQRQHVRPGLDALCADDDRSAGMPKRGSEGRSCCVGTDPDQQVAVPPECARDLRSPREDGTSGQTRVCPAVRDRCRRRGVCGLPRSHCGPRAPPGSQARCPTPRHRSPRPYSSAILITAVPAPVSPEPSAVEHRSCDQCRLCSANGKAD